MISSSSSSRSISLVLQCCLFLSYFGIHHAFVPPTTSSLVGQHSAAPTVPIILTVAAVKKGFEMKNNDNGETMPVRNRIIQRLRIQRRRKPQASTTTQPTGPATTYIPSGMTLEEYNSIKRKEAIEESTKNYGAWGPRFAQTDRPEGDWMVLPQLWTRGAVDVPMTGGGGGGGPGDQENWTLRQRIGKQVPAWVLTTILLDSILTGVLMYKTVTVDWGKLLKIALRLPVVAKWKQLALFHVSRMQAIKALVVVLTAPLLDRYYLDRLNRYRLWSKRRTVVLSTLGSLGLLGLWAVLLGTLKRTGIL